MDTQANGSNSSNGTKAKQPGTTFNVKVKVGEENGKAKWVQIGRVFIRADGSGGAAFIGTGDKEKVFNLFPKDRKAAPASGTSEPKPAQAVGAAAPAAGAWG